MKVKRSPYRTKRATTFLPAIKQLPFRAAIRAKLNVLLSEYGSVYKVSEKTGIHRPTLERLLDGNAAILNSTADKIDEHYFVCWERREVRANKRRETTAERKAREALYKGQCDEEWRKESLRQAVENGNNFVPDMGSPEPLEVLKAAIPDPIMLTPQEQEAAWWGTAGF